MRVRSLPLLACGVALMVAALSLGAVVVHDGKVGTDLARLHLVAPGDDVRVKGESAPCCREIALRPLLREHSTELVADPGVRLVVTGPEPFPEGTLIVRGEVLHRGPDLRDPSRVLVVLHALEVTTPLVFG